MNQNSFRYFPPERMNTNFPWTIWAVGWLALFKAFLWLAYEPVQTEAVLRPLGYKYTLDVIPLVIFGFGIWNLRRWAVWGIVAISIANLIFFVVYPQTIYAAVVESEVFIYSILLSLITLLCNGPLGDFLILCAVPSMLKHTRHK